MKDEDLAGARRRDLRFSSLSDSRACARLPGHGFRGQTKPSKTKPGQIKPSNFAWFNLVLFVRIWTFQWVTTNANKNFSSCHRLRARFLNRTFSPFCWPTALKAKFIE